MTQEEELQKMHADLIAIKGNLKKTSRRNIAGMLILILVTLISIVYAVVKNVEATRNAEEANRQRILAEESKVMADANAKEAARQSAMASEIQRLLDECRQAKK